MINHANTLAKALADGRAKLAAQRQAEQERRDAAKRAHDENSRTEWQKVLAAIDAATEIGAATLASDIYPGEPPDGFPQENSYDIQLDFRDCAPIMVTVRNETVSGNLTQWVVRGIHYRGNDNGNRFIVRQARLNYYPDEDGVLIWRTDFDMSNNHLHTDDFAIALALAAEEYDRHNMMLAEAETNNRRAAGGTHQR